MNIIDYIKYGNISLDYKEIAEQDDEISRRLNELGLYDQLFKMPPPKNSSNQTVEELESCLRLTKKASEVVLNFCKAAEDDYCQLFIDYLKRHGIKEITKEHLNKIILEIDPLNFRLKEHYNRPRPSQLAYYHNINLHIPVRTTGIDNPSYPSGHAFEGYVISHLLGEEYPEHRNELIKLGKNIGLSRMIIGVHYKSDYIFGRYIGKLIIENKLINL